jgi:hypothetical protein
MARSRKGKRPHNLQVEKSVSSGGEPLSKEWLKEVKRRVQEAEDPIRYMITSEFSRRFVLYYNVSSDSFVMNSPEHGTQFKRHEMADRVAKVLRGRYEVVKFTTKNGMLKRLSPFHYLLQKQPKRP